jgi:hypothetical protein
MDKKVAGLVKDTMKKGEKMAPVKSIKLKVKFQKPDKTDKKQRGKLNKAAEKKFFNTKSS